MCVVKKTDNVQCRFLSIRHWPPGNSCTCAHEIYQLPPLRFNLCPIIY